MMPTGAQDPLMAAYLARLERVAAPLPEGRRAELLADIRGHLSEALADVPAGATGSVQEVLDRLGPPEDIVAAELGDEADIGRAVPGVTLPAPVPAPAVVPAAAPSTGPAMGSGWGPLEIAAVLLLTVGHVVLWVVGPLTGLVLAWISPRWTRREKLVATGWAAIPLLLVVGAGILFFFFAGGVESAVVGPVPADIGPGLSPTGPDLPEVTP